MNGGLTECYKCGRDPCACEHIKKYDAQKVVETAYDVFTRVKWWRMKIIKWIWPDLQRLLDVLYDHWDKS